MGIIIVNNDKDGSLVGMSKDGTQRNPAIPAVMVSNAYGALLLRAIRRHAFGNHLAPTVSLLLQPLAPAEEQSITNPKDASNPADNGNLKDLQAGAAERVGAEAVEPPVVSPSDSVESGGAPNHLRASDNAAEHEGNQEVDRASNKEAKEGRPQQPSSGESEPKKPQLGQEAEAPRPRLDLLVPTSSNAYVVSNILLK